MSSVNPTKDRQISLSKSDGATLSVVRMGLGRQAAPRKGFLTKLTGNREIDLDASAVLVAGKEYVDVVFSQQLTSTDGSVQHSGDNLVGGTVQTDDESIAVDLQRAPARVDQIIFTVNSFTGQTFQIVVMLAFGAQKLPELARSAGKSARIGIRTRGLIGDKAADCTEVKGRREPRA
ncbi:TerD family protein [Streptomyces sp. NPDC050703]|uniref:TerD family protein n=1 Tax=Streptomyces sp. NPDC050703 TaxID=3157218 RepID=UPI0034308283